MNHSLGDTEFDEEYYGNTIKVLSIVTMFLVVIFFSMM